MRGALAKSIGEETLALHLYCHCRLLGLYSDL